MTRTTHDQEINDAKRRLSVCRLEDLDQLALIAELNTLVLRGARAGLALDISVHDVAAPAFDALQGTVHKGTGATRPYYTKRLRSSPGSQKLIATTHVFHQKRETRPRGFNPAGLRLPRKDRLFLTVRAGLGPSHRRCA